MDAPLQFLLFEQSEDAEGTVCLDGVASVSLRHWPALSAELVRVLAWAHEVGGEPGPLDEGCQWHHELQAATERASRALVQFDRQAGTMNWNLLDGEQERRTVHLTLSLTSSMYAAFCDAGFDSADGDAA